MSDILESVITSLSIERTVKKPPFPKIFTSKELRESVRIRRFLKSVFSCILIECGHSDQKKLRIWTLFTQ